MVNTKPQSVGVERAAAPTYRAPNSNGHRSSIYPDHQKILMSWNPASHQKLRLRRDKQGWKGKIEVTFMIQKNVSDSAYV